MRCAAGADASRLASSGVRSSAGLRKKQATRPMPADERSALLLWGFHIVPIFLYIFDFVLAARGRAVNIALKEMPPLADWSCLQQHLPPLI